METAEVLSLVLQGLAISVKVDDLVNQVIERRANGQTDDEIKEWIKSLVDKNIDEAQAAIDAAKG